MESEKAMNNTQMTDTRFMIKDVLIPDHRTDYDGKSGAINDLLAEGGEGYYNYVSSIGLLRDPNLIVLSSVHHYYFDNEDLKDTRTVINLKQLNLIRDLEMLFKSVYKILPENGNFIGCFHDSKTQNKSSLSNILSQYHIRNNVDPIENGIISRVPFLNIVFNLLDSKTDKYLTERNVTTFLGREGFRVINITVIKGLTYFHAQKTKDRINIAV